MKFFPESRKKTIVLSVVIVVAAGATIYFVFFTGGSGSSSVPPGALSDEELYAVDTDPDPLNSGGEGIPGGSRLRPPRNSAILPYGSRLDLSVLEQEAFQVLRPFSPVEIQPDELGKENPFLSE